MKQKKQKNKEFDNYAWWFNVFKRGENKWSYLDNKDKLIKLFDSYEEAVLYAKKNPHLIFRK